MVEEARKQQLAGDDEAVGRKESAPPLDDGSYDGEITGCDVRKDPYPYLDIYVGTTVPGSEQMQQLKVGFPMQKDEKGKLWISTRGQLATMLGKLGISVDDDLTVGSLRIQLAGKRVRFLVRQDETDRGTFARIVKESLKVVPSRP